MRGDGERDVRLAGALFHQIAEEPLVLRVLDDARLMVKGFGFCQSG